MGKVNQLFQDEFQKRYEEIAIEFFLHQDDDHDKIEEIMCDRWPHYFEDERCPV